MVIRKKDIISQRVVQDIRDEAVSRIIVTESRLRSQKEIADENTRKSAKKKCYKDFVIKNCDRKNEMKKRDLMCITDHRVLDLCEDYMGFSNRIELTQAQMADILGVSRNSITSSVKRLCESGFIYKAGKSGHNNVLYLSPSMGWKGDIAELSKALKREEDGDAWWESVDV